MRSFTFVDSQVFAAARYAFLNRKERCVFCHLSKKTKTNFGGLCTRPTGSGLSTRRVLKRRLNRHATRMAWPGSRVQRFNTIWNFHGDVFVPFFDFLDVLGDGSRGSRGSSIFHFLFLNRCACLLWGGGSRGSRGSSIFQCFLFLNRMCTFPLGWCC